MQNIKTFFRMFSQLMQILNIKQKRQAVMVALISMVVATLETLGVSVILPFVLAMLQPETLLSNEKLKIVFDLLDVNDAKGIITVTAILVVTVYVVKNGIIILSNLIQLRFRNRLERDLSILTLKSYIYKPYTYFLNINSAEIMRALNADISGISTVVDSFCVLFTEGLTCIFIGVLLVVLNPVMAIGLLLLTGVTALTIVLGFKKQIGRCGIESKEAFTQRYQHSYQAVNGIKEIIVMKRQKNFLKKFEESCEDACKCNTEYLWIFKLPNRVIECIFICGLIVMVLISYNRSANLTLLVAQFSAVAVASVRILPSVSSIANSINSLVFERPVLETAHENITSGRKYIEELVVAEESDLRPEFVKDINIKDISWKYNDNLPYVLSDLSLDIKPGEAVGLIGESGAGKTTLADVILGLYQPQKGVVEVDGKNIFDVNTAWYKIIGYVPQSVFLIDDSIKNNILFGIDENEVDEDKLWNAIEKAQLKSLIDKQPNGIDTILGERGVKISGGQRQRIAIARALYYDPDVLVLDEATSALDNETENAVIESINALQGEKTLIIVAHRLSTIANCDKIYEIKNGKALLRDKEEVLAGE